MSEVVEHTRRRLGQLGWTVTHVADPALVVEGREMGVASFKIERDGRPTEGRVPLRPRACHAGAKPLLEGLADVEVVREPRLGIRKVEANS